MIFFVCGEIQCVLREMAALYTDSICLVTNILFPGVFYLFYRSSSLTVCLSLSYGVLGSDLTMHLGLTMTGAKYFTNSAFIGVPKSYAYTCILRHHCTWMISVAKAFLYVVLHFIHTNILLKASNLFWYLLKDECFCVRAKINSFQCSQFA